jgi:hypothetical protein|tara:strand:+ start:1762 stop:2631 length:870 start_codon:yes stop_codon:yes gene_type:complete
MKKIIGLICAWGVEDWIGPCLEQAEEYCDEVFLCVSSHNKNLNKFQDDTLKIAKEFKKTKIIINNKKSNHAEVKAEILNSMLVKSKNYKIGNWLWIMDADEFYFIKTYKKIKSIIQKDYYEKIEFDAKFFIYNMKYYIKSNHGRLYKIKLLNLLPIKYFRFRPTQQWAPRFSKNIKTVVLKGKNEMFHYSMLTNPNMRYEQWKFEYRNSKQEYKLKWFKNIFLKFDIKKIHYWINQNYKQNNVKNSLWLNNDFKGKKNGELYFYNGLHPEFIEKKNLKKIKDFRKYSAK